MSNFYKLSATVVRLLVISMFLFNLVSCGLYEPGVDTRTRPVKGEDRARQNIEEGKGFKLSSIGKGGNTNYEFSSSNPMWRSSLEVLDFLPLTTVDYSGGMIITDWYNDASSDKDSIKITVRFLSNEIQTNSLKIIVHRKRCTVNRNCSVKKIDSKIESELKKTILQKAARLEKADKKKKR